jgi:hypothetical protein
VRFLNTFRQEAFGVQRLITTSNLYLEK